MTGGRKGSDQRSDVVPPARYVMAINEDGTDHSGPYIDIGDGYLHYSDAAARHDGDDSFEPTTADSVKETFAGSVAISLLLVACLVVPAVIAVKDSPVVILGIVVLGFFALGGMVRSFTKNLPNYYLTDRYGGTYRTALAKDLVKKGVTLYTLRDDSQAFYLASAFHVSRDPFFLDAKKRLLAGEDEFTIMSEILSRHSGNILEDKEFPVFVKNPVR